MGLAPEIRLMMTMTMMITGVTNWLLLHNVAIARSHWVIMMGLRTLLAKERSKVRAW